MSKSLPVGVWVSGTDVVGRIAVVAETGNNRTVLYHWILSAFQHTITRKILVGQGSNH